MISIEKSKDHNQELLGEFEELRSRVHKEMEKELERRLKKNPQPTKEEVLIGAFKEMIEPQVRDAVFECFRKGYPTESSGFGGEFGEWQSLDGYFEIDEETKNKIEALGAKVLKGNEVGLPGHYNYTYIRFEPSKADIREIKAKWDSIVALLPPKNEEPRPSISGGAEDFRRKFAPEYEDIELAMLQRRLELTKSDPETEKKMRRRIKELLEKNRAG